MVKETTKTDSSPTGWNQHPGSGKSPNDIISSSNTNLNPQASNQTIQPPKSHNQWLEDLKRKRKKRWF